jgi:hypothetical protein
MYTVQVYITVQTLCYLTLCNFLLFYSTQKVQQTVFYDLKSYLIYIFFYDFFQCLGKAQVWDVDRLIRARNPDAVFR